MASAKPAWWLTVDGQSYGPYDLRTMQGYIAEGRVTGEVNGNDANEELLMGMMALRARAA